MERKRNSKSEGLLDYEESVYKKLELERGLKREEGVG